jgi:hypothetical protein
MSELYRAAKQAKAELPSTEMTWEERLEAQREEKRKISVERARDFVRMMTAKGVPTIPLFVPKIALSKKSFGGSARSEGQEYIGSGWLVQTYEYDPDNLRQGVFVCTDGSAHICQETAQGERAFTSGKIVDGQPYHDPEGEMIFGDDPGLEILVKALIENEVI